MSEVKRYDVLGDYDGGYIDEAKDGRVVLYTDYAALEAECERLREALRECLETMELFKLTGQVYVNGRTALSAKP